VGGIESLDAETTEYQTVRQGTPEQDLDSFVNRLAQLNPEAIPQNTPQAGASSELILVPVQTPAMLESDSIESLPEAQAIQVPGYIDPAFCERLNQDLKCENPSMLEGSVYACGRCQSCQCNRRNCEMRERIRQWMARNRYIYERTLLGDPRLFCERRFGSYVDAVVRAQIGAGMKQQMVLFKYDFQQTASGVPTALLKSSSLGQLEKIGKAMLQTGMPMVIERTGNQALDNRRRVAVVQMLTSLGFETNPDSVIATRPEAIGQSGSEAEIQYRSRITQAVRGSQAPASTSSSGGTTVGGSIGVGGN